MKKTTNVFSKLRFYHNVKCQDLRPVTWGKRFSLNGYRNWTGAVLDFLFSCHIKGEASLIKVVNVLRSTYSTTKITPTPTRPDPPVFLLWPPDVTSGVYGYPGVGVGHRSENCGRGTSPAPLSTGTREPTDGTTGPQGPRDHNGSAGTGDPETKVPTHPTHTWIKLSSFGRF